MTQSSLTQILSSEELRYLFDEGVLDRSLLKGGSKRGRNLDWLLLKTLEQWVKKVKTLAPPKKVNDSSLAEALGRHGGNQTAAAKELGVSNALISIRVKQAPEFSILAKFKKQKGKSGRNKKLSDWDLLAALKRHQGNQTAAAKELGVGQKTVNNRILKASSGSILAKYKTRKGKQGRPRRMGDGAIVAALKRHAGNQSAAARELGIPPRTLNSRIFNASPHSILVSFKARKDNPHAGKGRDFKNSRGRVR